MQHVRTLCVTSESDSMRCDAITAVSVRIVGFWDMMPPSLVLVSYSLVKGTRHGDRVSSNHYRSTWCHLIEDCLLVMQFVCPIFGSVFL